MHHHDRFPQRTYQYLPNVQYATAGRGDWYNHRRLHGSLGLITLVKFEQAPYQVSPDCGNSRESGTGP
jgi:transposase InsO family protein